MSTTAEPIRCTAGHPDDAHRPCNALLTRAIPGTVEVRRGDNPPPGCLQLRCERCGTRYVAGPRAA